MTPVAIFSGTWRDDDDVAFSPNAFSGQTYAGGGTAQKKTTKKDLCWQVKAARYAFYQYAHQWNYKLIDSEREDWKDYLEGCLLECRRDYWPHPSTYSATCGYAACNAAQLVRHAFQRWWPIDFREMPHLSIVSAIYYPATKYITVKFSQDPVFSSDPYDGVCIYQINPAAIDHLWSCWHTFLIAHDVNWPPALGQFEITGKSRWPVKPGEQGQVMLRWWAHHQHIVTRRNVTYEGD